MQLQHRIDTDLKFSKWIKKLNILDHKRATRVFYAEIRSKNITADHFGPVKNKSGTLSTTLHDSLENWAAYYSELYKYRNDNLNYDSGIIRYPTMTDTQKGNLNGDICTPEIIHAINSLKDYSTPGEDNLLSRDFTILLHLEPGQKSDDYVEGWTIINFISKVISDFWHKGKIPPELKGTILRPFLKSGDKDPTCPKHYRPIALLNSTRKIYEQILKNRIQSVLEEIKFFSISQAAYRYGRSTCDHLLVLQFKKWTQSLQT